MSNPYSLNPARQPDETQDEYRERRKTLQTLSKKAGRNAKVLFNSKPDPTARGRTAVKSEDVNEITPG